MLEQPGEGNHIHRRRVLGRDAQDGRVLLQAQVALVAPDGRVGNVSDVELSAALDEPRLEVARVEHVAAVLHGGDARQAHGFIEVPRVDVREPDRADLAFFA